ncbi:MAG: carboxypeptidase-like regulatory domain-containing protein, partial [Croceimicrobium sp.]
MRKHKDTRSSRFSLVLVLSLMGICLNAQDSLKTLDGWVLDGHSKETVPGVHVINKRTLKGTISDANGYFEIDLKLGDSFVPAHGHGDA